MVLKMMTMRKITDFSVNLRSWVFYRYLGRLP